MHLVLDSFETSPATHNERIVGGENSDDIDASFLEVLETFDIWWEVVTVACGLVRLDDPNEGFKYVSGSSGQRRLHEGLTVKAPGTETITTFLSFQSSVEIVIAGGVSISCPLSPRQI